MTSNSRSNDSPEIYILGSSSAGNAYIFRFNHSDGGHSQILVEAGFPWRELMTRATLQGVRLSECEACLITHCHGDHATGARVVNAHGITVYASEGTLLDERVGITPNDHNTLREYFQKFITPRIKVLPFYVDHDAPEPMGFVIRDTFDDINILFINDCKTTKANLSAIPLDLCFVECNYSDQPMHIEYNKAIEEGDVRLMKRYKRIMEAHMGLSGCRKLLNTLDLSRCRGIFLMHLSDRNARINEMREKVGADHPDVKIFVCKKNGGIE